MTDCTLRPATAQDVAALAAIAAAGYRLAFLPIIGEVGLAAYDRDFFIARFAREWRHLNVAVDARGRPCGFAEVREGTLDMLFVDPAVTGGGIGAQLLAGAEARGAVRLECFRDNDGARRFYERHGWRMARAYSRAFAGAERAFVAYEKL